MRDRSALPACSTHPRVGSTNAVANARMTGFFIFIALCALIERGKDEIVNGSSSRAVVMSSLTQFGHSGSGLVSQKLRDIDAAAPRARLPPRALPDSVQRFLHVGSQAEHRTNGPCLNKRIITR